MIFSALLLTELECEREIQWENQNDKKVKIAKNKIQMTIGSSHGDGVYLCDRKWHKYKYLFIYLTEITLRLLLTLLQFRITLLNGGVNEKLPELSKR